MVNQTFGMEDKLITIQMLSRIAWVTSDPILDMDITCLSILETSLRCLISSSFQTMTINRDTIDRMAEVAAVAGVTITMEIVDEVVTVSSNSSITKDIKVIIRHNRTNLNNSGNNKMAPVNNRLRTDQPHPQKLSLSQIPLSPRQPTPRRPKRKTKPSRALKISLSRMKISLPREKINRL